MSEMIDKLRSYGADVDGALERMVDDEELYEMCLEKYFDDENFNLLVKYSKDFDVKNAFDAAHALKGVSANLGLKPILDDICVAVEKLRAGNCDVIADVKKIIADRDELRDILGM